MKCNRVFAAALLLLALSCTTYAEEFSEVEYYANLENESTSTPMAQNITREEYYAATQVYMAEQGDCPPSGAFVIIPQYFNSRADRASGFDAGGTRLKTRKSHANGMGFTAMFNKRISDLFSVAFMYEYAFMKVNGGIAVPDQPGFDGYEKSRYHSHVVGVVPEFNFGNFGKLQLSVIQGFDRPSGTETFVSPAGVDARSNGKYGTNVTSLMAWYEKDFALDCEGRWKLTPYAGWRSLYVDVQNANNWQQPNPALPGYRNDDNLWIHVVSGGLKLGYQCGNLGFNVRGGVNHRTTHDDLPGYGNRAVAPGVVMFSHRANQDRTVGTFGAGVSYVASKRLVVSLSYDGFYGRDTSAHTGTLAFAIPF